MIDPQSSLNTSIKGVILTRWFLMVIVIISIVILLFGTPFRDAIAKKIIGSIAEPISPPLESKQDEFNNFKNWSFEEKLNKASMIAIVKYVKEGERSKAVFTNILKQSPEFKNHFKVGDEYAQGSYLSRNDSWYQ